MPMDVEKSLLKTQINLNNVNHKQSLPPLSSKDRKGLNIKDSIE
jgi:hypothetical protein